MISGLCSVRRSDLVGNLLASCTVVYVHKLDLRTLTLRSRHLPIIVSETILLSLDPFSFGFSHLHLSLQTRDDGFASDSSLALSFTFQLASLRVIALGSFPAMDELIAKAYSTS